MLNEIEHLLVCVIEEGDEVGFTGCKALRFGLDHVWPEKGETNRRILERELAQLLAIAELLGLKIRDEDKIAKIEKLKKYMELSRAVGTLEPKKITLICGHCGIKTLLDNNSTGRCPACAGKHEKDQRDGR